MTIFEDVMVQNLAFALLKNQVSSVKNQNPSQAKLGSLSIQLYEMAINLKVVPSYEKRDGFDCYKLYGWKSVKQIKLRRGTEGYGLQRQPKNCELPA